MNGLGVPMLPGAAAEHEPGLLAAEADAAYRWIAPAATGRNVCEVGCDEGPGAAVLTGAGARSYVGTSASERVLERGRREHGERAKFVLAEPTALPLAAGSYELVICFGTVDPSVAIADLLDSLERLLGEGGVLAVSLPTAPSQDPIGGAQIGEARNPEQWSAELSRRFANVRMVRRRSSFGSVVLDPRPDEHADSGPSADSSPPAGVVDGVRWLGADPGEERSIIGLASDGELPELGPAAALVGARDVHAYQETILAWEHRARRAEAEGAAKHWELVASREAQRRLRKRLYQLEHTPLRKLIRRLRGKPARLGEGPPIRPPEDPPELWE